MNNTLNTENVQEVIDFLENETTHRFKMACWLRLDDMEGEETLCDTVACIGGTCEFIAIKKHNPYFSTKQIIDKAVKLSGGNPLPYCETSVFLGLTQEQRAELTHPKGWSQGERGGFSRSNTIVILKYLKDHDAVRWDLVIPNYPHGAVGRYC